MKIKIIEAFPWTSEIRQYTIIQHYNRGPTPKYRRSHNIKAVKTEIKKIMCRWYNCLCRKAKRIYRNIIRITNFSKVAGYKNQI